MLINLIGSIGKNGGRIGKASDEAEYWVCQKWDMQIRS